MRILVTALILIFTCAPAIAAEAAWQKSLAEGNRSLDNQSIAQAKKYYRQAVREVDIVPHAAENKVKCLNALANVLALEDKTDEATVLYKKSLNTLELAYGKNDARILSALFILGSIYESAGDHEAAMQYYKRAIAINEKHYGPYCPVFANQLPSAEQSGNRSNQVEKSDQYQNAGMSILSKEAGLNASKQLKDRLPSYSEDLLDNEDKSDQDLTNAFQNEIVKTPADDIASKSNAASSSSVK